MKYRKWDTKTKMQIILESLEGKMPLLELCNKYQIRQSMYYYWLKELQAKGYKVFESEKQTKKEQKLIVALLIGMRRGEILNLRWRDLNFDLGLINVEHTKSSKVREIPMADVARDVL